MGRICTGDKRVKRPFVEHLAGTKSIPRWDVHFGGLEDDRRGSTASLSPLGLNSVATDSAVLRYVHSTLALV